MATTATPTPPAPTQPAPYRRYTPVIVYRHVDPVTGKIV